MIKGSRSCLAVVTMHGLFWLCLRVVLRQPIELPYIQSIKEDSIKKKDHTESAMVLVKTF